MDERKDTYLYKRRNEQNTFTPFFNELNIYDLLRNSSTRMFKVTSAHRLCGKRKVKKKLFLI